MKFTEEDKRIFKWLGDNWFKVSIIILILMFLSSTDCKDGHSISMPWLPELPKL